MNRLIFIIAIVFKSMMAFSQVITSVWPPTAYRGEIVSFTLSGQNLQLSSNCNIKLKSHDTPSEYLEATNLQIINSNTVTGSFFTNCNPLGSYDYFLYNPLIGSFSFLNGITISQNPTLPEFVSISPSSGIPGQSFQITITGNHTYFNSAYNPFYNIGYDMTSYIKMVQGTFSIKATNLIFPDDHHIIATFKFPYSVPLGLWDLKMDMDCFGSFYDTAAFTLNPSPINPEISSCNPAIVSVEDTLKGTITCTNTAFLHYPDHVSITFKNTQDSTIKFSPASYHITILNDLTLKFSKPLLYNIPLGTYDLYVFDDFDGRIKLANALTLVAGLYPPSLESVSPDTIYPADLQTLTLKGSFHILTTVPYVYTGNFWWKTRVEIWDSTHIKACYYPIVNDSVIQADLEQLWSLPGGWYNLRILNHYAGSLHLPLSVYLDNPGYQVGMSTEKMDTHYAIFPNPSTGQFSLMPPANFTLPYKIQISDVYGRVINESTFQSRQEQFDFDLSDIPKGVYLIRFMSDKQSECLKILLE